VTPDVTGVRDTPADGGRTRPVTDTLISTRRGWPDKAPCSVTSCVASGLGAVRGRSNTWYCANSEQSALEATQGQKDGFFRQLPFKCHLEQVAFLGD